MQITRSATTCISFPPKLGWAEFWEVVLHRQEVARFSNIRPGMESNSENVSPSLRTVPFS